MITFFFWFGIVTFSLIVIILITSGIIKDSIVYIYRFFYALNLKRNDKPKFEIGEIVEYEGEEFKVHSRYFNDMNNDYDFKWMYIIHTTDPKKDSWYSDEVNRVYVYSDNLKRSKFRRREGNIDKILTEMIE